MNKIYIILGLITAIIITSVLINTCLPRMNNNIISEIEDYNKIIENKDNIVKVTKITESEGEEIKEELTIEEGYDFVKSIKIIKKTSMSVTDNSKIYKFEFKDKSTASIYFEGPYLRYNNENYEVEYQK